VRYSSKILVILRSASHKFLLLDAVDAKNGVPFENKKTHHNCTLRCRGWGIQAINKVEFMETFFGTDCSRPGGLHGR
jgi:hypothetical protein